MYEVVQELITWECQFIASKTKTAIDDGLGVILCCGETLEVGFVDRVRVNMC